MIHNKEPISFIIAQLAVLLALSAVFMLYDWTAAYSAITGGLIATLANAWFTVKVFAVKSENEPSVLLRALYTGEIYKILLTGALFVVAFVLIQPINAVTLLATYFVVHMTPATWGFLISNGQKGTIKESN